MTPSQWPAGALKVTGTPRPAAAHGHELRSRCAGGPNSALAPSRFRRLAALPHRLSWSRCGGGWPRRRPAGAAAAPAKAPCQRRRGRRYRDGQSVPGQPERPRMRQVSLGCQWAARAAPGASDSYCPASAATRSNLNMAARRRGHHDTIRLRPVGPARRPRCRGGRGGCPGPAGQLSGCPLGGGRAPQAQVMAPAQGPSAAGRLPPRRPGPGLRS